MKAVSFLLVLGLCILSACSGGGGGSDGGVAVVSNPLGQAIENLPASLQEAFDRGRLVFERRFKPSEGLGPFFNATSCAACHNTPVDGGSAPAYRNFFMAGVGVPGFQTPVPSTAGILPSLVIPAFRTNNGVRVSIPESVPPFFNVTVTQRNAPPMFGVGLFEFVSDATILSRSDPDDSDGDGISGRANRGNGASLERRTVRLQVPGEQHRGVHSRRGA